MKGTFIKLHCNVKLVGTFGNKLVLVALAFALVSSQEILVAFSNYLQQIQLSLD